MQQTTKADKILEVFFAGVLRVIGGTYAQKQCYLAVLT